MSSRCRASLVCLALLLGAAGLDAREFKVCAEPNNLPYSNRAGEGFENRIAALLADALGATLTLVPIAQDGPGFLRATLGSGRCDALLAMPAGGAAPALLTRPYYRAGWLFVSRADRHLDVADFDAPALRTLRIGVPVVGEGSDTPPLIALGRRGLVQHLQLYSIGGDSSDDDDATARMVEDVAAARIDLAIVWGPAAGYHAARSAVPLTLRATPRDDAGIPLTAAIGVAVRNGNTALRDALDAALAQRAPQIRALLAQYHVPTLDGAADE